MPDPKPRAIALSDFIGRDRAGQFLAARIYDLIHHDLIPLEAAEQTVCQAVAAGDPWTLADAGQLWTLRPDSDREQLPAQLYVVRRTGAEILAEDEHGQQAMLGLTILSAYDLDHWYWAR
ncbi:hypothetical protein AB0M05_41405 [Streptomyces violaceusniger]|uniref:hypothetical protein n=1 Tax=Streptomyces violaceusniger TaxID=68280 RepID=UPI00342681AB